MLERYFARDPRTGMIGGYLEGVKDGRAFLEALREASEVKPVVIWKVGKGESSSRAAASHTGSLAGSGIIWEDVLRQGGAIPASGIDETADILLALKYLGRNPGRRLLISGGGGGLGAYAADLAEKEGLEVPPLEGHTLERLRKVLDRTGAVAGNPLDIGAPLIPLDEFRGAFDVAAGNPTTDMVILDLALNSACDLGGEEGVLLAADTLIEEGRKNEKPVIVVLYSRAIGLKDISREEILRKVRDKFLGAGVPVFPSMQRAMRAISRVNS